MGICVSFVIVKTSNATQVLLFVLEPNADRRKEKSSLSFFLRVCAKERRLMMGGAVKEDEKEKGGPTEH